MTRPAFKKVRPRAIAADPKAWVDMAPLSDESSLPLVVSPAVPDLDGASWLRDARDLVEAKLARHGALLFRGFNLASPGQFEAFAGALCPDLFGEYGDLPPASGKVYGVTPYPPEGTILFHNESSHLPRWPMKQFFFCQTPAASGGETPIVDCRALYRSLPAEMRERFARKGLRYTRHFIEGVDVSWRDFFKTERREEVEAHCRSQGIEFEWRGELNLKISQQGPAAATHPQTGERLFFNQILLHHAACLDPETRASMQRLFAPEDMPRNVFYGDGEPISDALVAEIERLCWALAVSFPWRAGDVLAVDNMLVSHGRKPYRPPRRMFVAMGDMRHSRAD